jgi:class 3 adenylate cyclase
MKTAIKQHTINKSLSIEVLIEIAKINQERIKIFSFTLSVASLVLLVVDFFLKLDFSQFAYLSLYATHWYLFSLNVVFIVVYFLTRKKKWGNTLVFILCMGMGLNGAVVAGVPDTLLNRGVIAFNVSMLSISVFTFLLPLFSVIVYVFSFLVFLLCLLQFQTDSNILSGNLINSSIITLLSATYSFINFRNKKREIEQSITIREQNKEIERLINNILPTSIVAEIKKEGKTAPKYLDNVTIGFIDFVSFSKIASHVTPEFIVTKLNHFFSEFDAIIKNHKLEKLKTIGDGYMFAGGLFTEDSQLTEMLDASKEITEFLMRTPKDTFEWKIRIGIHTGPVVAGIIGEWRFIYDVWGDTVNIAARLESASEPNRVNVSHTVYELTKQKFSFEHRGILPVKNMDPIDMYFLKIKPE